MKLSEVIERFHLLMDDTSELSEVEEVGIANDVYKLICITPFEFMKKAGGGNVVNGELILPSDFLYIPDHYVEGETAKTIFVDDKLYNVSSISERRDASCYYDLANKKIIFKDKGVNGTADYTYVYIPADLNLNSTVPIPVAPQVIAFGMAVDNYIMQQFEKARTYLPENKQKYDELIERIHYYNSNLISL